MKTLAEAKVFSSSWLRYVNTAILEYRLMRSVPCFSHHWKLAFCAGSSLMFEAIKTFCWACPKWLLIVDINVWLLSERQSVEGWRNNSVTASGRRARTNKSAQNCGDAMPMRNIVSTANGTQFHHKSTSRSEPNKHFKVEWKSLICDKIVCILQSPGWSSSEVTLS